MTLTEIEFISGLSSLISIIIYTFIGIIIISKYFKYKQRTFILFGITIIGFAEPFYGPAFSFLSALITGKGLSAQLYLLASFVGLPFSILCFITFVTDLWNKKTQKLFQWIFLIYGIMFEIYLIYFLIYDPILVGVLVGITDAEFKSFALIYIVSLIIVVFIGGTLIVRTSLKSDKPELRLKGKLLLPAFYLYVFSGIVDAAVPLDTITLPLNRIILICCGILFYLGFILPDWLKNLFLKTTKSNPRDNNN